MKRIFASLLASLAALTAAISVATPASAAANSCSAGTYWIETSRGSLGNGMLYGGMCLASGTGNDIRRVNVGYQKTSGSGVSVRMGWELVNSNATINGGSWWSGTINMSAGQTREVAFTYGGGVYLTSTTPCFRSKMKDMIAGTLFWGKIICP